MEYHPYWHEDDLVAYCAVRNITYNGYSPLGARDVSPARYVCQAPLVRVLHLTRLAFSCGWDVTQDKTLIAMAAAHKRTPAQIVLRWEWQQGILINPRTMNVTHMVDNRNIFEWGLTEQEMTTISQLQAPTNKPKVDGDPHNIP